MSQPELIRCQPVGERQEMPAVPLPQRVQPVARHGPHQLEIEGVVELPHQRTQGQTHVHLPLEIVDWNPEGGHRLKINAQLRVRAARVGPVYARCTLTPDARYVEAFTGIGAERHATHAIHREVYVVALTIEVMEHATQFELNDPRVRRAGGGTLRTEAPAECDSAVDGDDRSWVPQVRWPFRSGRILVYR